MHNTLNTNITSNVDVKIESKDFVCIFAIGGFCWLVSKLFENYLQHKERMAKLKLETSNQLSIAHS